MRLDQCGVVRVVATFAYRLIFGYQSALVTFTPATLRHVELTLIELGVCIFGDTAGHIVVVQRKVGSGIDQSP